MEGIETYPELILFDHLRMPKEMAKGFNIVREYKVDDIYYKNIVMPYLGTYSYLPGASVDAHGPSYH